jgi:UDP-glucose 4-epimerase
MPVLITGATGFIGVNLAEALLSRGETVILFSRRSIEPEPGAKGTPPGAFRVLSQLPGTMHIVTGDMMDPQILEDTFQRFKPETVLHGAAITPGLTREKAQFKLTAEVNFLGTINILEAACKHPPRRFVYLSSGSVYGQSAFTATELDEETTIPLPDSAYSIAKYAGERASLRYGALWDMDVISARIGTVFGPWEWDTGIRASLSIMLQLTTCALSGEEAVMPQIVGRKDWVYSRDIADAILALMDAPSLAHGVYNLGSGVEWTVGEWCEKLASAYPGFTYRTSGDDGQVNCHYGTPDRAPFATRRLTEDTGFQARFGLDQAFEDYIRWIGDTPDFWAG